MNREPDVSNSTDPIASQPPKAESESIVSLGAKLGETVGSTALSMGKAAVETAAGLGTAMTATAQQTGKTVVETAAGLGEILGHTTAQTSKSAIDTAAAIGSIVGKTSTHVGQTAIDFATWASDLVVWMGEATVKQGYQWVDQATKGTGYAVTALGNNSLVRRLSGLLRIDWLVGISDRIDLQKAQAVVEQLQAKYPDESSREIAHRIMVEKAMYAAGTGVVSSLVPGAALALLAIDLAATTALQTEMVYQIAAAYGLDLKDPGRKGEVLAIFGLALGGSKALQAGLGFLRNVPLAGAMIGAGTNATMMYTLGYAACRFYEAKQSGELIEANLANLQQESDRYLQKAIEQQQITDQVLARMLLASYPNKTWREIQPELDRLQLSDRSIQQISDSLRSPQPLDQLLDQLDPEFAAPLYVQCQRVMQMDREINAAEAEILSAIEQRFDLPQQI
ncbi:hypothetical protein H6F67_13605 [Microcoleus sp. FACHB-1515]|uniref:EcsC family protein n=1 Tax=Cyanophyceae TaxID=3028117 RepID=UPI00168988CC|nr:EcsC family protein [Microcoleus sp. FACHB-1515]MBD2090887.1 hypothetical protein [Microcoleus sp. FACHB-1515]